MFSVTRREALESRKRAIAQDFKVRGEYYSPSAYKYLKGLQEYGIYCREEKKEDWLRITRGLINTIGSTSDWDWCREAYLFESTCTMLEAIHGDADWSMLGNSCSCYPSDILEGMTELLLEFSPNGIGFVDNVVSKHVDDYENWTLVHDMYNSLVRKDTNKNVPEVQLVKKSETV